MISKLKNLWNDCKYDVYFTIACVPMWILIENYSKFNMTTIMKIILIASVMAIFRLIGYKEGQRLTIRSIISHEMDIDINVDTKRFEPILYKLKDVNVGRYFTLLRDKHHDKFIKLLAIEDKKIICMNIFTNEVISLNECEDCIVYDSKSIFVPEITLKKETK